MEEKKVDILLATYNGERFLLEQINSLINQTHKNFKVYISDDGSNDNTLDIIKNIQDPRFEVVNSVRVGGVINNFELLLSHVNSDYTMLCDQDDYWFPEKIEYSLKKIQEIEIDSSIPVLGFSDLELVDENLSLIADSYYKKTGLNPNRNLNIDNLSWMGSIYGCTIIMNKAAINHAQPFPKKLIMHDHWLGFKTLSLGKVFFMDKTLIKYRQHNKNVAGGMGYKETILQKVFSIKKYKDFKRRAVIVSNMHNIQNFKDKYEFSKVILRSFKYCETKKYPLLFLIAFIIYG